MSDKLRNKLSRDLKDQGSLRDCLVLWKSSRLIPLASAFEAYNGKYIKDITKSYKGFLTSISSILESSDDDLLAAVVEWNNSLKDIVSEDKKNAHRDACELCYRDIDAIVCIWTSRDEKKD